jgi:hypothetical protein
LHAAGPAENNLRTAIRTVGGWLGHRRVIRGNALKYSISSTGDLLIQGFIGPPQTPNGDRCGSKNLLQLGLKIPLRARHTAKQIKATRPMFWECVAGEVRLGKQTESRDSTGSGKLIPQRFADRPQHHFANHFVKKSSDTR